MKYLLCLILVACELVGVGVGEVMAVDKGQVMVINQVRGKECCGQGRVENLRSQLQAMEKEGGVGFWLMRYDALVDEEMVELVDDYRKRGVARVGVLMEVTPQLAGKEAYEEKGGEWYEAGKVFTVGYSQKKSREMIDKLMVRFMEQFGVLPEISGGWMIDAGGLSYLSDRYGVEIFEITREQWGTDTYKLYGGWVHYPYLASESWPLVANFDDEGILVVRQTVSDPLFNYGDSSDGYTSQPNDYLNAGRGFEYFKNLLDQAVLDNQQGWAVLGLENSMEEKYQKEFAKQIEYVGELVRDGQARWVRKVGDLEKWKKEKVRIYKGKDLLGSTDERAWWVESDKYRLRLRSDGEEIWISDLRVYDEEWGDPYKDRVVETEGVWVVPFLLDGSRWKKEEEEKLWWRGWFGPPKIKGGVRRVKNDVGRETTRLELGEVSGEVELRENSLWWNEGRQGLVFERQGWESVGIGVGEIEYMGVGEDEVPVEVLVDEEEGELRLEWRVGDRVSHWLRVRGEEDASWSVGVEEGLWGEMLERQYKYVWPEARAREVGGGKSVIYVHNGVAVAGRNPVRIVVLLYDKSGVGVVKNEPLRVDIEGEEVVTNVFNQKQKQVQLIDISSQKDQKVEMVVELGDKKVRENVWLAPNCKERIGYCIRRPIRGWWYARAVMGDWLRRKVLGEVQ